MIKIISKRGKKFTEIDALKRSLSVFKEYLIFFIPVLMITFVSFFYIKSDKFYDGSVKDKIDNKEGLYNSLVVKFDSIPDLILMRVTDETYTSTKKGDRICFELDRSQAGLTNPILELFCILLLLGSLIFNFLFFIFIIEFIYEFLSNYKIIFISSKLYKARKLIDPYGEETWDDEMIKKQ